MIRHFLLACLLGIISIEAHSQQYFVSVKDGQHQLQSRDKNEDIPDKFELYTIDIDALQRDLALWSSSTARKSINIPMPGGKSMIFNCMESEVLPAELAAKYPSIKTYKGKSIDGLTSLRFETGPYGFHGYVRTPDGDYMIEPYSRTSKIYAALFEVDDLGSEFKKVKCGVDDEIHPMRIPNYKPKANRTNKVEHLKYRLAVACTGEFGAVRGTVENALADIATSVNRLNEIFENDLGVTFNLIPDNDKLIFLDAATDPYAVGNVGGEILRVNTFVLDNFVGRGAYDLGHVYTRGCTDVGGVAFGSGLCDNTPGSGNRKGAGVTCNGGNSVNILTAAHEIGHQLSASHTWTRCGGGSEGQFAAGTAFEPGSGNTILSYANLCGQDNVSGGRHDHYHWGSLNQMYNFMREGLAQYACAEKVISGNTKPEIKFNYRPNMVIPINTPFYLTAEVKDEDGDALTFAWDQINSSPTSLPLGEQQGDGASFRALRPSPNPTRIFPALNFLLSNTNSREEILPFYTRNLDFALVVRDNNPEIGGTVWDYVQFRAVESAGPFVVQYPNEFLTFEAGEIIDVQWDVANTDVAPVSCDYVDIYLSVSGNIFTPNNFFKLASRVPNNGVYQLVIPEIITNAGRIVVVAHDNIFFDISDINFRIIPATQPRAFFNITETENNLCLPFSQTVDISTAGIGGFQGEINFEVNGLPNAASAIFSRTKALAGETIQLELALSNDIVTGRYAIEILGVSELGDSMSRFIYFDVTSTNYSDISLVRPEDGVVNGGILPVFEWSPSVNASQYIFELSTSPAFPPASTVSLVRNNTTYTPPATLDKASIYFWRVAGANICGVGDFTDVRAYQTQVLNCQDFTYTGEKVRITESGTVTVDLELFVPSNGEVQNFSVKGLRITHTNFRDLRARVIAPSGQSAILFDRQCLGNRTLLAGFNDQAPEAFNCIFTPPNKEFRPLESFTKLDGASLFGNWRLRVEDTSNEDGGEVTNFGFEICSLVEVNQPVLVVNDTLKVKPLQRQFVTNFALLAESSVRTPAQLVYTLITNPQHGYLEFNGARLTVGSKFTQDDLFKYRVQYVNQVDVDNDAFRFIVDDGAGGWIQITDFHILIGDDLNTSTSTPELHNRISAFPNPVSEVLKVMVQGDYRDFNTIRLYDHSGRMILQRSVIDHQIDIDFHSVAPGFYILTAEGDKGRISKKIVVQK